MGTETISKLNALKVRNAKPGRHGDGGGLYLLVKPSGARSWVLRLVLHGRRRDFGLGGVSFDPPPPAVDELPLGQRTMLSLQEARQKAAEGRRLAKAGLDPAAEWRKAQGTIPTFEEAARLYHAAVKPGWKPGKHGDQWISTLEAHVFPLIGPTRVDMVNATAIQSVLMPIWLTIPETARRVRQRVAVVLDFAKSQNWRETEAPMRAVNSLMRNIKQPKGENFPAVPWAKVPDLMSNLRAAPESVSRLAVQFNILTAARPGMVRGLPWKEINLDEREWRCPPDRMKAEKLHITPLTPAAVVILERMRELYPHGPEDLVFPSPNKAKAMSDVALSKVFKAAGGEGYTVHGTARSSFRDWAAENGFPDAWAETALAHGPTDKTVAAYKRTTFFTQRAERLMPAWERFLLGSSNVVTLAASA